MIQRMEHDKPEVKSGARSCEPSTSQVVRFTYHLAASNARVPFRQILTVVPFPRTMPVSILLQNSFYTKLCN